MPIYFYTPNDAYGAFSNFSPHGVEMGGVWWATVEHYFQAQKFGDAAHRERVRRARTPKEAKALGWDRSVPIRSDWDAVKDDVMRAAVEKKFATHAEPRALLLGTGDETLVESAPGDYYWGCGADGTGRNRLGEILMEVRARLRG